MPSTARLVLREPDRDRGAGPAPCQHGLGCRVAARSVRAETSRLRRLAAQPEPLDELLVALVVLALQIVEQPPALAHHHQEAAPGMEVAFVRIEVVRQVLDPLAEDRDLDLRRAGIGLRLRILVDERTLALRGNRHRILLESDGYRFSTRTGWS